MTNNIYHSGITECQLLNTGWYREPTKWFSNDTHSAFVKNSKILLNNGVDWEYYNKDITYRFNKQGYRTDEWDVIDWPNSVVVLGCSYTFGEGLSEEDNICGQLSDLLNRPVINLGAPGTGIQFSAYNSLLLNKNFPTPYAVIQNWSGTTRFELYKSDRVLLCNSMSYGKQREFGKLCDNYYKSTIALTENLNSVIWFAVEMSRAIWTNKTRYYEITQFGDTASLLGLYDYCPIDYARDLNHPGIKSASIIAEQIAKNIG